MRTIVCSFFVVIGLLTGPTAFAQDFFPLEPGNKWAYRSSDGSQTMTIEVGSTPILHGNYVYHRLTGYTQQPIWTRINSYGGLFSWEPDTNVESPITLFERVPAWFEANGRECYQIGRTQPNLVEHRGPAGNYKDALLITYLAFDCADAGIQEEQFLANVGMLRQVRNTLAGPVTFELVYAKVGTLTVAERGGSALRLNVRRTAPNKLTASLRLTAQEPFQLDFPTAQEYDFALRDSSGNLLWKWSEGKYFASVTKRVYASEISYEIDIPLDLTGFVIRSGAYDIQAWLTTTPAEREFAITTRVTIETGSY